MHVVIMIVTFLLTELMAECLRQRYIQAAYVTKSSEKSQALKRKAPNLSNAGNPGTMQIYQRKMQRCHLGEYISSSFRLLCSLPLSVYYL